MSHEQTAKQLMDAVPNGKKPRGQPRNCWPNYVKDLARSCLEIPRAKLPLDAGDRDAWRSQLKLLHPQTQKDKQGTNSIFFLKVGMIRKFFVGMSINEYK